ncbi:MAG TPA: hypothetical protein PLW59_05585 [Sphaerochaeta sp.]|jgi:hypothetical protein|nr:hypothetical protein [Sphaerochaeta sp.]
MDSQPHPLPLWYERMLSSAPKMLLFALITIICTPLLLLFGALAPLFRKYL